MTYEISPGGKVWRTADGAVVPRDPRNPAWQEYQAWVAAGNTASPREPQTTRERFIPKTRIIRRATDEEVEVFEDWLANTATARQRALWRDAEGGLVAVADVRALATALFGAERAAELLR